jgi:hypothetical protein
MTDAPSARKRLANRRGSETRAFEHGNQRYTATVSRFEDTGEPAELFLSGSKIGSQSDALVRDASVLVSIALQFGAPLAVIAHALLRDARGGPSTAIGMAVDMLVAEGGGLDVAEDSAP